MAIASTFCSDEEAEEEMKRFIADPEDVEWLRSDEDWRMFLEAKLKYGAVGAQEMSDTQWAWMGRAREVGFKDAGFTYTRFIDRWGIERTQFRDPLGKWMARTDALEKFVVWQRR